MPEYYVHVCFYEDDWKLCVHSSASQSTTATRYAAWTRDEPMLGLPPIPLPRMDFQEYYDEVEEVVIATIAAKTRRFYQAQIYCDYASARTTKLDFYVEDRTTMQWHHFRLVMPDEPIEDNNYSAVRPYPQPSDWYHAVGREYVGPYTPYVSPPMSMADAAIDDTAAVTIDDAIDDAAVVTIAVGDDE